MNLSLPADLQSRLSWIQRIALLVGVMGVAAFVLLGFATPKTAYPAYLVAFVYWTGISLACLMLVMLHYLVGGNWGYPIKRPLEAGALVIMPMALLFIPVVLGMKALYPWTDVAHLDEILLHKKAYLNSGGFIARGAVYFLIWSLLAYLLNQWSSEQDTTSDPAVSHRAQRYAAPGLIATFLAASFAAIDWCMSLEPHWYSSLYSPLLIVGWGLTTFAFMVIIVNLLSRYEPMASAATSDRLHDLGNLMLAFTMIWAYMSFMQYLITWSGNLTEEIPWYLRRTQGGWQFVAVLLIVFQFFLPFIILLFRDVKRGVSSLAVVAGLIMVMRVVDLTWLIVPASNDPASPAFSFLPVLLVPVAIIVVGGVWVGCFLWLLQRRPLLPLHDPGIPRAVEHTGGH